MFCIKSVESCACVKLHHTLSRALPSPICDDAPKRTPRSVAAPFNELRMSLSLAALCLSAPAPLLDSNSVVPRDLAGFAGGTGGCLDFPVATYLVSTTTRSTGASNHTQREER